MQQSHGPPEFTGDDRNIQCCPIPLVTALMIQTDTFHEHIPASQIATKPHCSDPDSEDRASGAPSGSDESVTWCALDLDPMMMTSDEIEPMTSADPKVTHTIPPPADVRQMQNLTFWSLHRHSLL